MKKKIYLVCTHPRDQLKLGGIYIFKRLVSGNANLCNVFDLPKTHLFVSRFKKFTDIEQAKFMAIKIKLEIVKISKPTNKQTCNHNAQECVCI